MPIRDKLSGLLHRGNSDKTLNNNTTAAPVAPLNNTVAGRSYELPAEEPVIATVAPTAVAPVAHHNPLDRNHDGRVDMNDLSGRRMSQGYEVNSLSQGYEVNSLSQGYEMNQGVYVQSAQRASITRAEPTIIETIQKDVVIQERIHPVEKEEIQPIIYREREQLDVKQVTQMLHETQIEPTIIQQRELPAERREAIIERGAAIEENIILPSVHRDATLRTQQIHAPIVEETIKRTVIEEIQPVLERDVFVPTVIQNTQPIYEKIVEAPTVYREVRDMRVQSTEFVQPALYTQPALPVYTQPAVRETIVVPSAPKVEYVTMATTTTTNETFVPAKLIQEGELRNWQPAASQVAQAPIRRDPFCDEQHRFREEPKEVIVLMSGSFTHRETGPPTEQHPHTNQDTTEPHNSIDTTQPNEHNEDIEGRCQLHQQLQRSERRNPINVHSLQANIERDNRSILLRWIQETCHSLQYGHTTFLNSVHLVDRVLSLWPLPVDQLQLVGVTCFFISAKLEEFEAPEASLLNELTDNTYSIALIIDMERMILNLLGFDVLGVTAAHLMSCYTDLTAQHPNLRNDVLDLVKECLIDGGFMEESPSILTAAAVVVIEHKYGRDQVWGTMLERITGRAQNINVSQAPRDAGVQIFRNPKITNHQMTERPLGRLEKWSVARQNTGVYFSVLVGGQYSFPDTVSGNKSQDSQRFLHKTILECLPSILAEHPPLNYILDGTNPTFRRLSKIDLEKLVSIEIEEDEKEDTIKTRLDSLIQEQLNTRFPIENKEIPLWRIRVLMAKKEGRWCSWILFVYHHSIADGMSGKLFHESLLSKLNKDHTVRNGNPGTTPPLEEVLDMRPSLLYLILTILLELILPQWVSHMIGMKKDFWVGTRETEKQIPNPYDPKKGTKTRQINLCLEDQACQGLYKLSKEHDVTMTSIIDTLIAFSIASVFRAREGRGIVLRCNTPMNLREEIRKKGEKGSEVVTSGTMGVMVGSHQYHFVLPGDATRTRFWSVCKEFHRVTEAKYRVGMLAHLKDRGNASGMDRYIRNKMAKAVEQNETPRSGSFELSNLGLWTPEGQQGQWNVMSGLFAQSNGPLGSAVVFSSVTVKREGKMNMNLCMNWQEGVIEEWEALELLSLLEWGCNTIITDQFVGNWLMSQWETLSSPARASS
ncbi:hypothetical protein PROFUN_11697 [Planoprotostelium fungivorum]|uniref:Cyclin-like domain-containing protein n=1 Tax=Planoprotostelium fungivorum TaxID=1890364 RepID=A0A2P6N954_9EUKA|nr:hypothetical protein PROFUN_11697 [Planoprotostelium fungivorum]